MRKVIKKLKENSLFKRLFFSCLVLMVPLIIVLIFDIANLIKDNGKDALYTFPPVDSFNYQKFILSNLNLFGVLIGLLIGFYLSYIFIYGYLWIMKKLHKLDEKKVGFVITKSDLFSIKTLIWRILIAALLTYSFLIIFVENETLSKFWWISNLDYNNHLEKTPFGNYSEFIHLPWQWISLTMAMALLVACWTIIDSGLVSIKDIERYPNFKDAERVGNFYYRIVKGYIGISIIISWIWMILEFNIGLAILPFNVIFYFIPFIVALDYFRNFSNKLIFSAVKKIFPNINLINIKIIKDPIDNIDKLIVD